MSAIDDEPAQLLVVALKRCDMVVTAITGEHDSVHAAVSVMQPAPLTRLRAKLGNRLRETLPEVPACACAGA